MGRRILFAGLVAFIALNASYLAAFDSPTIFYHANVVAHVVLGVLLVGALLLIAIRWLQGKVGEGERDPAGEAHPHPFTTAIFVVASIVMGTTGIWLIKVGTASPHLWKLRVHEAGAVAFLASLGVLASRVSWGAGGTHRPRTVAALVGVVMLFPLAVRGHEWLRPVHVSTITNPSLPPLTPNEEGGGRDSPYFPSSNKTASGKLIPSDFFLESKACGNKGCHPDITAQWESSAHHFSSFNNQWYRKSVEYMQDVIGTKPSKWCGGCHDMAVLLTGRMDTPIKQQIHTPQAQAGIACLVCHSIVHVSDTMGQGGFTLEYPEMHRLVASENPYLRHLHDFMVRLDPAPHKQTMLKPFHRSSTPEFCSSCHKVHLDVPVNHYRWFRGFNDYDAWQQSGVSGQGARAFYYPPDGPKKCGSCHMPLVKSNDMANINGFVHSHRFPAANTALPLANGDKVQFETVKNFLQNGILTLDIFAVSEEPEISAPVSNPSRKSRGGPAARSTTETPPAAQSMFPEEGGFGGGMGAAPAAAPREIIAPIERAEAAARAGSTVRVDVVARTRKIGHFFPGGTVDAFDVWLELKAEDAAGRVLYWSGWIADEGKGPVDPGAHFYKSLLLDEHGNRINKRNAWAARAIAYVRLIPPGAADTAHFRLRLPRDVAGPVKLTARMNYRKFSWFYTRFSFAGMRDPSQPQPALSADYDDGRWVFTGDTSDVSGSIKGIPDLPTIVVAEDTKLVKVGPNPLPPAPNAKDRERWNDYGIGLLLQKDFKGADDAFTKVAELEPGYADGWVNRARVAVEEGDHSRALEHLDRALKVDPALPKAHYFRGVALRSFGRYDEALGELRKAAAAFPRDRVVLNAIGRILFLKRQFGDAVEAFKRTLAVDAEDLTAHYNLMLCYRGLHDEAMAKTHEQLYARFKADESSQFLTGAFRLLNPDDNRERQAIHEHDSTWTPLNLAAASGVNQGRPQATAPARETRAAANPAPPVSARIGPATTAPIAPTAIPTPKGADTSR